MHTTKPDSLRLISRELRELISASICDAALPPKTAACVHFKDPKYSHATGGFHPVEIGVAENGVVLYITDFAFVGMEPFIDLAKELDFDFEHHRFQQFGREFPLDAGRAMFKLWQRNFLEYHRMGVYTVTVEALR